jgi:hypothetical protein
MGEITTIGLDLAKHEAFGLSKLRQGGFLGL